METLKVYCITGIYVVQDWAAVKARQAARRWAPPKGATGDGQAAPSLRAPGHFGGPTLPFTVASV